MKIDQISISRELAELLERNLVWGDEAYKAQQELRAILAAPAVERQEEWAYCPECGCKDLHHEQGEHKQCANCYQEWFSDIDYSEVVRGNLEKLKASPPAPVAVDERAKFVVWVRREWLQAPLSNVRDLLPKDDPRYGEYCDETLQRAWVGWQARACLDKVKEMNA